MIKMLDPNTLKDPLNFSADSEYRRREEAVEATRRTMKELARSQALAEMTQTSVKIQDTVTICL